MREKSKIGFLKSKKKVVKFSAFLLIAGLFFYALFSVGIAYAKDINFGTAGDRIILNGNIGVGITAPLDSLQVRTNANQKGILIDGSAVDGTGDHILLTLKNNAPGGIEWNIDSSGGTSGIGQGKLSFQIGKAEGTAPLVITNVGRVGIGTINPGARLTVSGAANSDLMTLGTASGIFGALAANGLYGLYAGVSNDGHVWMQVGRNDASAATYPLVFNPGGGNVGIGTSNPGAKLEVAGNTVINASSVSWTEGLNIDSSDGVWGGIKWRTVGRTGAVGNWHLGYNSTHNSEANSNLYLYNGAGNYPMMWTQSGNVGIGTTAPNDKLSIGSAGVAAPAGSPDTGHNYTSTYLGTDNYALANYGLVKTLIGNTGLWGGTKNGNIYNGDAGAGNVGIGGTAPAVRLDVQGGTNPYGTNIYGMWTPDGNSLIRNWALNDGANNYTGAYTSVTDAPLGSKTMRYSSNTYFRNAQWVPVDTTRTYKISVWGRTISGTPNNYLSLTQAGSDLSQPSNGGWGNPYWGVTNQPFPAAWTYYTMTIGPSGSGASYVWSAGTKYVQLGALMIYTGSGVCEIAGYKIEEVSDTIAANASALGTLNIPGNNSLSFNSWGGGFFMQDTAWVRTLNSKNIWTGSGILGTDGGLVAGYGGATPPVGGAIIAGSVGIGVNPPSYKLDVIGNGAFRSGDNSYAYFGPNASWGGSLYVGATSNKIGARTGQVIISDGNLHIDSGNTAGNDIYLNYYNSAGHAVRIFGPLNMNGNQINGLATPGVASDAATKGYVDSAVSGGTVSSATYATYINTDAYNMKLHWAGQGGQPTWLWGSNSGADSYVYNPSNFSVNYANSAGSAGSSGYSNYLSTNYVGGQQANPQTYFNNSIGLKVAMTGSLGYWYDTVWINGYAGGDVPNMIALHTSRNGEARMWLSSQPSTGTSFGTAYEFITTANVGSQTVSNVSNLNGTWSGLNYFLTNNGGYAVNNSNSASLEAYSSGGNSAFMSFHRGGYYAVNFGLDADNVMRIGGWSAGANRWQLDMSGNETLAGYSYAQGFIYNSDQNLKKNIATIESPLEKILQLRGVTFDWKKDNKSSVGLIAQEVEKVFPDLVSTGIDGNKGVQYGNLVAPLIEAVKAQQKEIEILNSRIETLELKNRK